MSNLNQQNAKRQHLEVYAPALVSSYWLKIFSTGLLAILVLMGVGLYRLSNTASHQRLIVLAGGPNGSLDSVAYTDGNSYRPGDKTVKHFAVLFVQKYFSRSRYTLGSDYADSLQFLSPTLYKEEIAKHPKSAEWIEEFKSGSEPETRIKILKARGGSCASDPCHLSVDFEKHFWRDGREDTEKAESWTADLSYSLMPESAVKDEDIPVNPIGMTIGKIDGTKGF